MARAVRALDAGKSLSLLFDYDGTLTPIVSRPEDATLAPDMRDTLNSLAALEGVHLAVISGRPLPVLQEFLDGVRGATLIGDHGAELDDPAALRRIVLRYLDGLRPLEKRFPGCALEDKDVAVGVHFRNADPDAAPALMAAFFDWWLQHGDPAAFQVAAGKKVFEIRPRTTTNKGTAVLGLLERMHGEHWPVRTMAVYAGDDTTDEDAFKALERNAGEHAMTILVSEAERRTQARWRVASPAHVQGLLQGLAASRGG